MISSMALEFLLGLMEIGTRGDGDTINRMARVQKLLRVVKGMRESTKTISSMALEFLIGLMGIFIKVNGKMTNTMERVYKL